MLNCTKFTHEIKKKKKQKKMTQQKEHVKYLHNISLNVKREKHPTQSNVLLKINIYIVCSKVL